MVQQETVARGYRYARRAERHDQNRPGPPHWQLCARPAVDPIPPAQHTGGDEESLQGQIRIQPGPQKHQGKQPAADNSCPPGVSAVSSRQQDRGGIETVRGNFPPGNHNPSSFSSEVYCTTFSPRLSTASRSTGWPGPNKLNSACRIGSNGCAGPASLNRNRPWPSWWRENCDRAKSLSACVTSILLMR